MNFSVFQIVNLAAGIMVVLIGLRYLWLHFSGHWNRPYWFEHQRKRGNISSRLRRMEFFYPDKIRFFSWWLQIERIEREGIRGAFAELGVYQGKSAAVIHAMAPERDFYLFDTFSGFPGRDLADESGEASTYTELYFSDTSAGRVMKRLGGSPRIRIMEGYFPDSAAGCHDLSFALVNIDADLYHPTKQGLSFFYPRLSPGGVIFIHDYNPKWEGVIRAVDEFCRDIPESFSLLPDRDGTAMIIKNSN